MNQSVLLIVLLSIYSILSSPTLAVADLSDGLVAYYPFDGNANDASGNEHHGTLEGATLTDAGILGDACDFDGIDDFVDLPHILTGMKTNFSFSAWVYARDIDSQGEILVHRAGWHDVDLQLSNPDMDNGHILWRIHDENSSIYDVHRMYSDSPLENQQWYHLVGTYDGTSQKMYINGELQSTILYWHEDKVDFSSNYIGTWLGKMDGHGGPHFFNGIIDEVRIYDRALYEDEAMQLAFLDDDGDGIPNDWESEHFGSATGADPDGDPDGDGSSNLAEFRNQTDPRSFDLMPCEIGTVSTLRGVAIELKWGTVTDRNYQIQWKASLSDEWENVGATVPGNGDVRSRMDTRGYQHGYYRIVIP